MNGELVRLTPRARVGYVIDVVTGCWNWTGSCRKGYGKTWDARTQRISSAHCVVYEVHRGPIPAGKDLDHLCRNRRCVNPEHMEPVTRFVNLIRGAGVKLTWEQVRALRSRYAAGGVTHRDLAKEFGISNRQSSQIVMGRSWPERAS